MFLHYTNFGYRRWNPLDSMRDGRGEFFVASASVPSGSFPDIGQRLAAMAAVGRGIAWTVG